MVYPLTYQEMGTTIRVQILEEAVLVSLRANAHRNGTKSSLLRDTNPFNFDMASNFRENFEKTLILEKTLNLNPLNSVSYSTHEERLE